MLSLIGQDACDRKLMTEHIRRASKVLRILKEGGNVQQTMNGRGNVLWQAAAAPH